MPEELIKNWRFYKEKIGEDIPPLKKLRFEILIRNLLQVYYTGSKKYINLGVLFFHFLC